MPGIDYTLGMKTAGFDSGVTGALGKLAKLGAKVALITATGALALGGGLTALAAKSIGKAADMETLETAFAPLLGGIAKSRERIAELSRFAATTPFEMPEVADASRVLETLTKGALSTGRGLTLVGDVASATKQPFDEIAVSVGRLYDGLDSGRPVGEALMRLQELGVVAGDTRSEIETLQAEGKRGAEVWAVAEKAMSRFSGSMERQSGTWNGKMSTLSDTISMTMAQFGKPIMDSLKPYLDGLTSKIEGMQSLATTAGQKIAGAFDVALAAYQTGNIAGLLGDGMVLAAIDSINAFSAGIRGSLAFLEAGMKRIMADVGKSLGLSELLGIFSDLAKGIGSIITAAILEGLKNVPGLSKLQADADRETLSAQNSFNRAGNRIADFDGGSAIKDLFSSMTAAVKDGKAAFVQAAGDPLIDRGPAAERFNATMGPILARIEKNKADFDAKMAAMDARLNNSKPSQSTGSPADRAAQATANRPTADRLRQIGGYVGAGSAGISQRLAERTAQFTEQAAKGIEKLVAHSMRPAGTPEAVF
jgi:hypothetical protein